MFLIAGPCAAESAGLVLKTASALKEMCQKRGTPLIFKTSFDKANRTSGGAARGPGMKKGLEILAAVRRELSLPVLTDVHLPQQAAEVAETADILQIPAFLCRQTDLIEACAATGKPLNIKKGQFLAPEDMLHAAEKAKAAGAAEVLLCERGACFGYRNLVADMRSLAVMRAAKCPVVFDATHSAQLPGADGGQSGGARDMVPLLARAAAGAGIDGIFIETHPSPKDAVSDSATQWPLDKMEDLLDSVLAVDAARRRFS